MGSRHFLVKLPHKTHTNTLAELPVPITKSGPLTLRFTLPTFRGGMTER